MRTGMLIPGDPGDSPQGIPHGPNWARAARPTGPGTNRARLLARGQSKKPEEPNASKRPSRPRLRSEPGNNQSAAAGEMATEPKDACGPNLHITPWQVKPSPQVKPSQCRRRKQEGSTGHQYLKRPEQDYCAFDMFRVAKQVICSICLCFFDWPVANNLAQLGQPGQEGPAAQ